YYCDTGVSGDGQWHVIAAVLLSAEGWQRRREIAWPPDPFYDQHLDRSVLLRVALDGSGRVEHLFDVPKGFVSHVSVNPRDPDLLMYCHDGARAFQWGRLFLRRVGESSARPLRDQRS